jgi:HK97 family phage prohead protease
MAKQNNKYDGRMGKRYKSIQFDTKETTFDSESRTISGYAAIFGNIDKAGDMLIKGCFSRSIQERGPETSANDKIAFLWMHDMSEPIARITVLKEDDRGLYFEAVVDDVDRGNQALKQLESGTLNQFSIGYRYVWENCEYDSDKECFIVKEVILYEISVVTIGCNGETEYLGLKTIETVEQYEDEYKNLNDELDSVLNQVNKVKQQKIQRILAKAMALASIKLEEERKSPVIPLEDEQAVDSKPKSMFESLIN